MPFGRVQLSGDAADRVWQGAHRFDPGGHGLHPGIVERQPVEKGAGQPAAARLAEVFGVGGQNLGLCARTAAAMRSRARSFCSGAASASVRAAARALRPDRGHCAGQIAATLNALQRRGHRSKTGQVPERGRVS